MKSLIFLLGCLISFESLTLNSSKANNLEIKVESGLNHNIGSSLVILGLDTESTVNIALGVFDKPPTQDVSVTKTIEMGRALPGGRLFPFDKGTKLQITLNTNRNNLFVRPDGVYHGPPHILRLTFPDSSYLELKDKTYNKRKTYTSSNKETIKLNIKSTLPANALTDQPYGYYYTEGQIYMTLTTP